MNRTHNNGCLNLSNVNEVVELKGWVSKKRNLGGLIFIDLRDRYGITQIVVDPKDECYEVAESLKNEYVVYTKGTVIERSSKNPNLKTGDIEVHAMIVEILNTALQPPIIIADKTDALEDTRLKYRYLDLRRPIMQNYLIKKSQITSAVREFLTSQEFLELETPILAKSTPEGARDYLVPSRLYPGEFYALPQSPQIFKQLYMISGFERYFQIARCFRDEDLRADRQPEFTQIDIETSFLNDLEIQEIIEKMFVFVFKKILNIELKTPFKRMTYLESMNTYGSDKPDLRFGMPLIDVKNEFKGIEFMVNNDATKCIVVNNAESITRKSIDKLTDLAKKFKAHGLAWLRLANNELTGSVAKLLSDDDKKAIIAKLNLKDNDLVLIVSDKLNVTNVSLGAIRSSVAKDMNLLTDSFEFAWITDWPVFEYDEENKKYVISTHPFTAPKKECEQYLDSDEKDKCFANAYDLVLNGYELGSGSLRIYNQELQAKIFKACGLTEEEAQYRFGFFVEALKYGTPPHGGIGLGLDRITMLMTNTDNIKDVTAFPKTQSARDLMMESPSRVDDIQLKEVHIKITE